MIRKFLFGALFALLPSIAFATVSGTQTNQAATVTSSGFQATLQSAAVANGNGSTLNTQGMSVAVLTVTCTACSGGTTVNFEGTEDGTNYFSVGSTQVGVTVVNLGFGTSTSGLWQIPVSGLQNIRARISAYSAGTVTVTGHSTSFAPPIPDVNVSPLVVTSTDRGGTLPTGGTAYTVVNANTLRKGFLIQNPCTAAGQGIAAAEDLFVSVTGNATVAGGGNYADLGNCGSATLVVGPNTVIQNAVTVNATTTGHRWIATEIQ